MAFPVIPQSLSKIAQPPHLIFIQMLEINLVLIKQNFCKMQTKVFPGNLVPEPTKDSIKLGDISRQQFNVPEGNFEQKQNAHSANTASTATEGSLLAKKKIIIIAAVVGFVVIVGVVVGVVVGLNAKKNSTSIPQDNTNYVQPDPTPPSPSPSPSPTQTVTSCADVPSQCAGVPLGVSNYIFDTYNNDDQIRSLLQVSRTLTGLTPNSTTQELVSSYRDILRSAECLAYTLGSNYTSAYQDLISLQMTDQNAVETYLSMNRAFTGEPIRLTATADLINTCQFNVTTPSARRRLQQSQNCSGTEATSVLIYFDGMGYSPSTTIQNLRQIQTALEGHPNATFDGGSVSLGAFISQENFFENLVSAFQAHQNSSGQTSSNSSDLYRSLQLILDLNTNSSRVPNGFEESQYLDLSTFFMASSIQQMFDNIGQQIMNRHKNFVGQQIQEGKKVVFVAHGEGTFYANMLYNLLSDTQKQSVSEVFIGPLTSQMADNSSCYISHDRDRAVVRYSQIPNQTPPLSSNANGSYFDSRSNFEENHSMGDYMEAFRQTIVELIISARLRISQPNRNLGSGPITVALTWDNQPDLDLHIFEPNYHVYYMSRQGNNGHLDLDDTNGFGPEHYYTNCSIETGNYTFKVNYYWGSAPSSATVTVSAGPEYYTKQLVLETARQSSGDADPEYSICTVNVARSSLTDSYIFTIYPL